MEANKRIKAIGDICKKNNQKTFFPSVWYPWFDAFDGAA
jgi:hypothetical protein